MTGQLRTGLPSVKRSSCCEFLTCRAILAAYSSRQAKRPITIPTQHPDGIKSCARKWLKRDPITAVAACPRVPCEQLGYLWTTIHDPARPLRCSPRACQRITPRRRSTTQRLGDCAWTPIETSALSRPFGARVERGELHLRSRVHRRLAEREPIKRDDFFPGQLVGGTSGRQGLGLLEARTPNIMHMRRLNGARRSCVVMTGFSLCHTV